MITRSICTIVAKQSCSVSHVHEWTQINRQLLISMIQQYLAEINDNRLSNSFVENFNRVGYLSMHCFFSFDFNGNKNLSFQSQIIDFLWVPIKQESLSIALIHRQIIEAKTRQSVCRKDETSRISTKFCFRRFTEPVFILSFSYRIQFNVQ